LPSSRPKGDKYCAGMARLDKNVKILLGVGSCFVIVGIVLIIVARVVGGNATTIEWEAEGVREATIVVPVGEDHCGIPLFVASSQPCQPSFEAFSVEAPAGVEKPLVTWCEEVEVEHNDKKLHVIAHIEVTNKDGVVAGSYRVTNSRTEFWAADYCGEIAELQAGLLTALGLVVAAIILFIISCVFCGVACCCACQAPPLQQQATQPGGMVVGQPTSGNVVVGSPVQGQCAPGPC